MEQEKYLLTKVLCTMLPYGIQIAKANVIYPMTEINIALGYVELAVSERISIEEARPYLRPMSSMTEEEKWDFGRIFNSFSYLKLELLENGLSFHEIYDITGRCDITWNELNTAIDWLLKHHFDYRGLIDMGLALPAPEGMYKTKYV